MMALSGFINLLKPPGMSSHDVVGFVRKVSTWTGSEPQLPRLSTS